MLATEHTVLLGHDGLDEGVTNAGLHGAAAQLLNELGHSLRGDQVVDDDGLFVALSLGTGNLALGHQSGHGRGGHCVTLLVNHEATVGVAVEGETDVCAVLHDSLLQVDQVGRLQRVGRVVREGAVQLEVQGNDFQGQARQDGVAQNGGGGHAAHAVTGVHHDLQRADGGEVHELAQVLCVGLEDVLLGHGADLLNRGNLAGVQVLLCLVADVKQTGFGGHRNGAGLSHLHTVVFGRVVASGKGNTGGVFNATCKVKNVGRNQTDLFNVCAASGCTLGKCIHEFGRGGTHIAADQDGLALQSQNIDKCRTGSANSLCSNGLADDATHVVRLE